MDILSIIIISFLIAVFFSILGLGGAIIYTPLFFWMGMPILAAIPMALFLNMITTASASMTYLDLHLVDKKIAYPLILTSITGAVTGSYIAAKIEAGLIIILLSTVLFIAAIRILFFNNIGFTLKRGERKNIVIGACLSFVFGIISSIAGIGGGTFIVPLLLILGLGTKNAAATSSFVITFTSFSGFFGHMVFGPREIDMIVLSFAGLAAFTGAQVGSKVIFNRIPPKIMSRLFGLVLLFIVGKLLYGLI